MLDPKRLLDGNVTGKNYASGADCVHCGISSDSSVTFFLGSVNTYLLSS